MSPAPDCELVTAYAAKGSETAFRALVARHVDLVYATAVRQVGDAAMAQEIAQNVFIALARKAPRLGGMETLGGWLHRATVLEAKTRIRAELRRKRREETAAEMVALEREGASPFAALTPLLDEALLNLRESDRLALVMRFLEERSLRDVGTVLGVDEDAARKRVSRALDRLTEFFRRRGIAVPTGSGAAALLASATQAAPSGLAASATQAGFAAGTAATGLNLIWIQLMALTKTQTALVCAIVAAAPLTWQWHTSARIAGEQTVIAAGLTAASQQADELEEEARRARQALRRVQVDVANAELRVGAIEAERDGQTPPVVYHWDDDAPLVRAPKRFLNELRVSAISNRRGHLSEAVKEVLQLKDHEASDVRAALDRFLAGYNDARGQNMRLVEPTARDLGGRTAEETSVFDVQGIHDQFAELRQTLFDELEVRLGAERFERLRAGLSGWMPVDDEDRGVNAGMAVFDGDHRVRFHEPKPGDQLMAWGMTSERSGIGARIAIEDIPEIFRAALQDWIAIAQSQPPNE